MDRACVKKNIIEALKTERVFIKTRGFDYWQHVGGSFQYGYYEYTSYGDNGCACMGGPCMDRFKLSDLVGLEIPENGIVSISLHPSSDSCILADGKYISLNFMRGLDEERLILLPVKEEDLPAVDYSVDPFSPVEAVQVCEIIPEKEDVEVCLKGDPIDF